MINVGTKVRLANGAIGTVTCINLGRTCRYLTVQLPHMTLRGVRAYTVDAV